MSNERLVYINEFISNKNLSINNNLKARFIDQKCTPNNISFIANVILSFLEENKKDFFTNPEILKSSNLKDEVTLIYGKPIPNEHSKNEYDKFVSQPVDLFAYAGILEKDTTIIPHKYNLQEKRILEYIALNSKNAFMFLDIYLTKVLKDSHFYHHITNFISNVNNETFNSLKVEFSKFLITNTNINKELECNRIFPKVINVFSVKNNTYGTKGGYLSKTPIAFQELSYNRENFRDIGKEKGITRKEEKVSLSNAFNNEHNFYEYEITKAKHFVKKLHPFSEISGDETAHIHHIFPKTDFPELASTIENLIALTAGEHLDKAHPKGNTKIVDKKFQTMCIKSKYKSVNNNIEYSKKSFVNVIKTGDRLNYNLSFENILNHYN